MRQIVADALRLIVSGDREVYVIVFASIRFSFLSTFISGCIGIPAGIALALRRFPGRRPLVVLLNSALAVPTVVIGLFVFSFLSRSGPFGRFSLLYTPAAIVFGQALLALPIIISLVRSSIGRMDPRVRETLSTFGARGFQSLWVVLREERLVILGAVLVAYGRTIGEIGISMMLGGNIRWYTRTLTTAIALETGRGEFELGFSLGIILLFVAIVLNAAVHLAARDA